MNRRRRLIPVLLLATIAVLLAGCGGSGASGGDITVSDARVPVPAGANGAAYLTLTNAGDSDDRLIGASSDVAQAVEIHESTTEDGSTAMRQVDGIDVPAGAEVVLEPGGFHAMLIGVTADLVEGDSVDLILVFENAGEQTVSAAVVPLGDLPRRVPGMASEGRHSSGPMSTGSEG